MVHRVEIPEQVVPGKRLGRHVEHDPRSRAYAFGAVMAPSSMRSVVHRRWGHIFDQGDLGSCTGNAAAGAANCRPLHHLGTKTLKEADAVDLYSLATQLDGFDGEYPPEDTGSSGLAVAQALTQKGLIDGYQHAFGIAEALTALQIKPVITGIDWLEGFDTPSATGLVEIAGQVRGGHEFLVRGFEWHGTVLDSVVGCDNSWGETYGHKGTFRMRVRDWSEMLDRSGDVTILGST